MVAGLAVVCFLASIFAQANSLACEQCQHIGTGSSCTGTLTTCPETATKCIQGLENHTMNGEVVLISFKNCYVPTVPEIACTVPDHMVMAGGYFGRYTATCSDDNSAPAAVPPINNTRNGYKCLSCYHENSTEECKPAEETECTGNQRECADMRGIKQQPGGKIKTVSIKGCVTEGSCRLAKYMPGSKFKGFTIECTLATPLNVDFSD